MQTKNQKPATETGNVAKISKDAAPPAPSPLENLQTMVNNAITLLQANSPDVALSETERRRLLGSGVRRYGFIDKVSDFAIANPDFIPPYMNEADLKDANIPVYVPCESYNSYINAPGWGNYFTNIQILGAADKQQVCMISVDENTVSVRAFKKNEKNNAGNGNVKNVREQ